ncbi:MAG: hypothetical protein ACXVIU_10260 [Halobacteriota archaeon]
MSCSAPLSVLVLAAGLTGLAVAILRVVWEAGKEVVIRMIDGIDLISPRRSERGQQHKITPW